MRLFPLVLMLAVTDAMAVRPPETLPQGREPIVMRTFDPATQALGETMPAWKDFLAGQGAGWAMRWDGQARVPHRMWGPGLDLGPIRSETDAIVASLRFARQHAELLGLSDATLDIAAVSVRDDGTHRVDLQVLVDDLPLWRSVVSLRFKQDKLVMVGSSAWPGATVDADIRLSSDAALDAFTTRSRVAGPGHVREDAALVLLPELRGGKPFLRAVWEVRTRVDGAPPAQWVGFVDAATGETLAFYNEVRFAGGTVTAEVDNRPIDDTFSVVPLARVTVVSDSGEEALTDTAGDWGIAGDVGPFSLDLVGPRVLIDDQLGNASLDIESGEHTVLGTDLGTEPDRRAALTAFHAVQIVQDVFAEYGPDVPWNTDQVRTNVNIEGACNAWFDGTINFLRAGQGCANTGRLVDVVYHEWGHGFHAFSLEAGSFDGSLGEGAADVVSMMLTDSPDLAPGFFAGTGGPLRDLDNDNRYPEDFTPNEAAVHSNGLIFGGAMWDLRLLLEDDLGAEQGKATFGRLFAEALKDGPDIPGSYDAIVFADDDDGDLSNGTPNQCDIVEAFAKHGLGPASGAGLRPKHDRFSNVTQGAEAPVEMEIPNPAPDCLDVTPTGGTLHWRASTNPGWQTADLVPGEPLRGLIPTEDLPLGTFVEYWAEIETRSGALLELPIGGPIRPHNFYVGDVLEVHCDDFEEGDGGYTSKLLAGTDEEGADDWMWGTPAGLGGDPDAAASGDKAWGNDLGGTVNGQSYNGQYQDGKHNRLSSPPLSTGHYDGVFLRYNRWLHIEDGVYDNAQILADGEVVWTNHASNDNNGQEHHLDDAWDPHVVGLGSATEDREVVLSWEIISDQGLFFGGWTLDDVCLMAPDTPDNRLGIGDFTASRGGDDTVTLSWTHPRHEPVETVRVVRTRGAWPSGHEAGTVVWESSDITPDTPITIEDGEGRDDLYYAVYASDGENWLSWTRPDLNAAAVDPKGGAPVDPDVTTDATAGCKGCAGSGSAPVGLLTGLLAFGLVRRRRDR